MGLQIANLKKVGPYADSLGEIYYVPTRESCSKLSSGLDGSPMKLIEDQSGLVIWNEVDPANPDSVDRVLGTLS